MQRKNILVICGPTSSGKTGLALRIAKKFSRINILSVDSRQIYKELDLVTGKDIPADLPENIKFFGLNLASPNTTFNLSDFTRYAQKVINESVESSTPLIVVGGTGLYLKAITSNFFNVQVPPNPALRTILEKKSLEALQEMLKKTNPKKYLSLNESDIRNPRRLIRAIEISKATDLSTPVIPPTSGKFTWIGLNTNPETLKINIRKRVIERLDQGAIQEVQSLLKKYPDAKLPIYTSLGVKQITLFLDKKISREELVNLWTASEIDYARRQMVWFKKQPGIIWYDKDKIDDTLLHKFVSFLKND